MFTNERLFTIQAFTITRVHCINKTYNILNSSNTLVKIGSYQAGLPSTISKGSLIGSLEEVSLSCSFPLFRFPSPVSISFWSMSGKTGMSTPSG